MSKPRYIRQRDKSSCGPTAIINALKWAGRRVTEKNSKKELRIISKCGRENSKGGAGTNREDLNKVLVEDTDLKVDRFVKRPAIKEIDNWIDSGGAVIIEYYWGKVPINREGHYTLCTERNSKTYTLINDKRNQTVVRRRRKTMRTMLRNKSYYGDTSYAWFIRK